MGYAYYTVWRRGEEIEAGYSVDAECERVGCCKEIDRGLDHLCGNTPGGDEWGCGGYFCDEDLFIPRIDIGDDTPRWLCNSCLDKYDDINGQDDPLNS
jgi:hypothetical protein